MMPVSYTLKILLGGRKGVEVGGNCNFFKWQLVNFLLAAGVGSPMMPVFISVSWGKYSDYKLVPTPKGHYLLK
jgi:hypothetical protein